MMGKFLLLQIFTYRKNSNELPIGVEFEIWDRGEEGIIFLE